MTSPESTMVLPLISQKIDGNADARSRLWVKLDATSNILKSGILPAGGIVRVTAEKWQDQQYLGGAVAMRARLDPPLDRSVQRFGNGVCFNKRNAALSML